jgi:hypothetical protein
MNNQIRLEIFKIVYQYSSMEEKTFPDKIIKTCRQYENYILELEQTSDNARKKGKT